MEIDQYDIQVAEIRRVASRVQEEMFALLRDKGWQVCCPTGGVPGEIGNKYWDWKAGKWVDNPVHHSPPMTRSQAEEVLRTKRTWLQDYETKLNQGICSNVVDS